MNYIDRKAMESIYNKMAKLIPTWFTLLPGGMAWVDAGRLAILLENNAMAQKNTTISILEPTVQEHLVAIEKMKTDFQRQYVNSLICRVWSPLVNQYNIDVMDGPASLTYNGIPVVAKSRKLNTSVSFSAVDFKNTIVESLQRDLHEIIKVDRFYMWYMPLSVIIATDPYTDDMRVEFITRYAEIPLVDGQPAYEKL